MARDDETTDPGGERHSEWERLRDEHGLGEVDHLAEDPGYRPRPGDHIVEPLFGALVEEHAEFEVVEEELEDGRRVSHLARVWRRVRLFWRG